MPRRWDLTKLEQYILDNIDEPGLESRISPTGKRLLAPCGTLAKYHYCKCSECRAVRAEYMRHWRAKHKQDRISS